MSTPKSKPYFVIKQKKHSLAHLLKYQWRETRMITLNSTPYFLTKYTPGTAGGPGGRDRTMAVKSRKNARKSAFFRKKIFFCIYLLVMPKYWGKQIFTHGRFPEMGQKQKTEERKERKTERW